MSVNKITCDRVKWALNYNFYSVGENVAELKDGETLNEFLSDSDITLIEKTRDVDGNQVIDQELTISVNESQLTDLTIDKIDKQRYILLLSRNDGTEYIWGNLTITVEAILQNRSNSQVEIKFFRTYTKFAEFGDVVITLNP